MKCFALDEIKFMPTKYRKRPRIIGSGIMRAIDGTAHRDIAAIKHEIEVDMIVPQSLWLKLYQKFTSNSQHLFVDDEGNMFVVVFDDEFSINEREQGDGVYYSGTQKFLEV